MEKPKTQWATLDGSAPIIIAHRGASGYLPEHTLEAYALAIDMGADLIEPDLVFTKDGVLVARHDRYLSTTTDVSDHPEFASRKRANNNPNDVPRDDWWIEDFTLAELKTLRARQPFPGRSKEFDELYEIPSFEEMLALVARKSKEAGRPVGVYPETKHPAFFASIGHDFEQPLLNSLEGFDAGPVFIQSFEPEILKRLKGKTNAKLVQLVYGISPGAGPNIPLKEISDYADAVGPSKELILTPDGAITTFVADAHSAGLAVHPWTFRTDQRNVAIDRLSDRSQQQFTNPVAGSPDTFMVLDPTYGDKIGVQNDMALEFAMFLVWKVDGVFTDFPEDAIKVRGALSNLPLWLFQ
jgi:glycerophosphoryl diester phosphodiesterase